MLIIDCDVKLWNDERIEGFLWGDLIRMLGFIGWEDV